jgi:Zn-finger nucleic acid-binding protein
MIFYQCSWCQLILTEAQYLNAKFDRCPRCGLHLVEFHQRDTSKEVIKVVKR